MPAAPQKCGNRLQEGCPDYKKDPFKSYAMRAATAHLGMGCGMILSSREYLERLVWLGLGGKTWGFSYKVKLPKTNPKGPCTQTAYTMALK